MQHECFYIYGRCHQCGALQPKCEASLSPAPCSAMWMCPACNHVMTEEQSKGYRGCPSGMHFAQHVPVKLVPCPDCYGGHFRPCQVCGDTGQATLLLPNDQVQQPHGRGKTQPEK